MILNIIITNVAVEKPTLIHGILLQPISPLRYFFTNLSFKPTYDFYAIFIHFHPFRPFPPPHTPHSSKWRRQDFNRIFHDIVQNFDDDVIIMTLSSLP